MKTPRMQQLAPGIYAYVQPDGGWCINNAGVVIGEDTTVVIDTAATERRARLLREEIAKVSLRTPNLLVNTHFHGDHHFGNAQFSPPATIVAHEVARTEIIEAGLGLRQLWPQVEWGETPLTPPTLTFHDAITIHAGQTRIELMHLGPAHTTNDIFVWVPESRVLFAGDVLWNGVTPFCLMGSIAGSLQVIERLRELDPVLIVPGHGDVGGPELFDANEAYLRWIQDIARDGHASGLSTLEVASKTDLGEFAGLLDPERLVGNLHRAYAELAGLAPGARIDVAAAFGEMVAHHGRLPDCHA
ncbi:MBL fold metallo-hydrolase [Rhizocola hellebori]|uniref:MBL fold metallo-hydrolase n=1 Tax=Rhizocola hellebori TaxID=1392758 RepID=UPI001EF1AB6C|nr:MBL fold metallo-hydrolase [Rhizocola hellebori]